MTSNHRSVIRWLLGIGALCAVGLVGGDAGAGDGHAFAYLISGLAEGGRSYYANDSSCWTVGWGHVTNTCAGDQSGGPSGYGREWDYSFQLHKDSTARSYCSRVVVYGSSATAVRCQAASVGRSGSLYTSSWDQTTSLGLAQDELTMTVGVQSDADLYIYCFAEQNAAIYTYATADCSYP